MSNIQISVDLENLKNLEEKLTEAVTLKVGWFPSAVYNKKKGDIPVATVAAIQEKGLPAKRIPPRPFLEPTVIKNKEKWSKIISNLIKERSLRNSFEILGLRAQEDVSKEISEVFEPPLKEITVRNRLRRYSQFKYKKVTSEDLAKEGSSLSKPLVDTGYMKATVSYEVE